MNAQQMIALLKELEPQTDVLLQSEDGRLFTTCELVTRHTMHTLVNTKSATAWFELTELRGPITIPDQGDE